MVQFICLFLPSVVSVWIFEAVSAKKLDLKRWVYNYSAANLLINAIVFLFKKYILNTATELLTVFGGDMTPEVAIRYLVMAITAAVALGLVGGLLSRKVEVSVESDQKENREDKNEN